MLAILTAMMAPVWEAWDDDMWIGFVTYGPPLPPRPRRPRFLGHYTSKRNRRRVRAYSRRMAEWDAKCELAWDKWEKERAS